MNFARVSRAVKVHPLFVLTAAVMIALDMLGQFFMLFLAVTLHELSHAGAARFFKITNIQIVFLPIGELVVLKNFETLKFHRKVLIVLAGPFFNIVAAAVFWNTPFRSFAAINLMLGLFNLLPIHPLDGGRLAGLVLGYMRGVLWANGVMYKFSRGAAWVFVAAGFAQTVLFPFNISLTCIGLYLRYVNEKEYLNAMYAFYRNITNKRAAVYKVRGLAVGKHARLKDVVKRLNYEHYCIIHMLDGGSLYKTVTEADLIEHICRKGISGTMQDLR